MLLWSRQLKLATNIELLQLTNCSCDKQLVTKNYLVFVGFYLSRILTKCLHSAKHSVILPLTLCLPVVESRDKSIILIGPNGIKDARTASSSS